MASPAIALASNVLPVPGGPTNKTPLGIRAPNFEISLGSLKSQLFQILFKPATSVNLTLPPSSLNLARERPKSIDLLLFIANFINK